MSLDKIQVLKSEYEMFLKRSSIYIGVTEPKTSKRFVFCDKTKSFVLKEITLIPAFIKVCDEAMVNASDAMQNLLRLGKKASSGVIEFDFDPKNDVITVKNYAPHSIEIVQDPKTKVWLPQTVFTKLHVSSNFTEEGEEKNNHKGGVNGIGTKAITYTSSLFKLEIVHNKKLYKQTFKDRGKGEPKPPVISDTDSKDYVSVSFVPNTDAFKTEGKKLLTPDSIAFLKRRCYDVALMNPGVNIFLNGEKISCDLEKYFEMCGFNTKNYLSYEKEFVRNKVNNSIKVFVFDSPVFGEATYQLLLNGLFVGQSTLHGNFISEFSKFLATATKRDVCSRQNTLMVKNNLSIFSIAQINNIDFTGQTKDNFEYGRITYGFDFEKDLDKIKKLEIWKLCTAIKQKDDMDILEKNITQTPLKLIEKYEDCELANRKRKKGEIATLIVVEGDSAKSCVMAGLTKEQRRTHGVYPFRGKPLNVLCCDGEKLSENKEFNELKTIVGLKVISDPVRNSTENAISKLRYDRIIILSDQDHDGAHIRGLVVNTFNRFWPHLLEKGFIGVLRTPIVNIYAKGVNTIKGPTGKTVTVKSDITVKSCYTIKEFQEWEDFVSKESKKVKVDGKEFTKSSLLPPKYIKGLGTLDKCNAVSVFELYNDYKLTLDEEAKNNIDLVFSKERANDRKKWICFGESDTVLSTTDKVVTVSNLLDTEVRAFSRYNTSRALPDYIDGFKTSNRKIAWVLYNSNYIGTPGTEPKSQIKVAQLGGAVSKDTAYHHGEASLYGAIVGMAQNFVGSNNLGPLLPLGQYGTRISGKSGAAQPRYIFTVLNSIFKLIFRKEDIPITTLIKEDGVEIEPERFIPIIPYILINGTTGIGSGYSCNIPKHHPVKVVDEMIDRIDGNEAMDLLPWFKYSRCTFQKEKSKVYQLAEFEVYPKELKIVITDLPSRYLFEETKKYYQSISVESLEADLGSKKKQKDETARIAVAIENAVLKRFDVTYTDNYFNATLYLKDEWYDTLLELSKRNKKGIVKGDVPEIPGNAGEAGEDGNAGEADTGDAGTGEPEAQVSVEYLLSKLRLVDTQCLTFSNAHAISPEGEIVKLEGVSDVIDRFYSYRFGKYKERKAAILKKMEYDIEFKKNTARFIRAIKAEKINIVKDTEDEILDYLFSNNFLHTDYLLSIPIRNITKERAEKLDKEIAEMIKEYDEYKVKKISKIWKEELLELRTALLEYNEPVGGKDDIRFPFFM